MLFPENLGGSVSLILESLCLCGAPVLDLERIGRLGGIDGDGGGGIPVPAAAQADAGERQCAGGQRPVARALDGNAHARHPGLANVAMAGSER